MESKQANRKLSSYFWYIIYSFPLLVFLIILVSNILLKVESVNLLNNTLLSCNNVFSSFTLDWLVDSFLNVFDLIGITDVTSTSSTFFIIVFTYFVQGLLIHVIVDVLTFIFKVYHKLMERVF